MSEMELGYESGVVRELQEVMGCSPYVASMAAQRRHLMEESIEADRHAKAMRDQVSATIKSLLPDADATLLELAVSNWAQAMAKAKYAEDKLVTMFPGSV